MKISMLVVTISLQILLVRCSSTQKNLDQAHSEPDVVTPYSEVDALSNELEEYAKATKTQPELDDEDDTVSSSEHFTPENSKTQSFVPSTARKGSATIPSIRVTTVTPRLKLITVDSQIFVGNQPLKNDYQNISEEDISLIIDLRSKEEIQKLNLNPRSLSRKADIDYVQIPWLIANGIEEPIIERINQIIEKNPKRKIWIHDASGQRARSWFIYYLFSTYGLTSEEAMNLSPDIEFTLPVLQDQMFDYLRRQERNRKKSDTNSDQ